MDTDQFIEQVNEVVESLLAGGSRYRAEKVATLVIYAVVSAASVVWAFSGNDGYDQLGARFEVEQLPEVDDQNFHLINDGDAWTDVRVVLNDRYLWTADQIPADSNKAIRPHQFNYYYYIPRPWGRTGWERLANTDKQGPKASSTLKVDTVQIRARQGSATISLATGDQHIDGSTMAGETDSVE